MSLRSFNSKIEEKINSRVSTENIANLTTPTIWIYQNIGFEWSEPQYRNRLNIPKLDSLIYFLLKIFARRESFLMHYHSFYLSDCSRIMWFYINKIYYLWNWHQHQSMRSVNIIFHFHPREYILSMWSFIIYHKWYIRLSIQLNGNTVQ